MHREGHYGVALLVYAPVAFLLLAAGLTEFALAGGAIVVGGAMLPDIDMRIPFIEHRGITHTVWFAIAVGVALAAVGVAVGIQAGPSAAIVLGTFGLFVGMLTVGAHLLADALTPMGIRPFEPIDEEFLAEPDEFPLCGNSQSELDFHHWRYGERKQGCYLCRECHDAVHASGAQPSMDNNWLVQSVEHLVELHFEYHGQSDSDEILGRYNVTFSGLIEHAISQISSDTDQ